MERNGRWKIDLRWREPGSKRWIRHAERLPAGITKETATARATAFLNAALGGKLNKETQVEKISIGTNGQRGAAHVNRSVDIMAPLRRVPLSGWAWVEITPEMATILLGADMNVDNRKISAPWVDMICGDLVGTRYKRNPHPIVLTENLLVTDGQHRLMGVAKTGIPTVMAVFRGPEAMESWFVMDSGRRRSDAEKLQRLGETNTAFKISIARNLAMTAMGTSQFKMMSLGQSQEWMACYADAFEWGFNGGEVALFGGDRRLMRAPVAAALMVAWTVDNAKFDTMTRSLISGEGLVAGTPVHTLREFLIGARYGMGKSGNSNAERARSIVFASCHAEIEGRPLKLVKASDRATEFFRLRARRPASDL